MQIRGMFKDAAKLPRSTPTYIVHNPAYYGVNSIIFNHIAIHIENAIRSFQKRAPASDLMRLRSLQCMERYHLAAHPLAFPTPTETPLTQCYYAHIRNLMWKCHRYLDGDPLIFKRENVRTPLDAFLHLLFPKQVLKPIPENHWLRQLSIFSLEQIMDIYRDEFYTWEEVIIRNSNDIEDHLGSDEPEDFTLLKQRFNTYIESNEHAAQIYKNAKENQAYSHQLKDTQAIRNDMCKSGTQSQALTAQSKFLAHIQKDKAFAAMCQATLLDVDTYLTPNDTLCIFTDGSAIEVMTPQAKAGAGLILSVIPKKIANKYVEDLHIREAIKNKRKRKSCKEGLIIDPTEYPHWTLSAGTEGNISSTLAELRGLTLAMCMAPTHCTTHIFTDNQGAIDIVNGVEILQDPSTYMKWKYCIEKTVIRQCKIFHDARGGKINIHKVRGHSQEVGNNIADKVAQQSINNTFELSYNPWDCLIPHTSFDKMPTDTGIRKDIEAQYIIENNTSMFDHRANPINESADLELYDTQAHLFYIHQGQKPGHSYVNRTLANTRKKKIQILTENLPTLSRLHLRKPDIYITDKCVKCKSARETWHHIIDCYAQFPNSTSCLVHRALQVARKTINKIEMRLKKSVKDTASKSSVANKIAHIEETWANWIHCIQMLFQRHYEQHDSNSHLTSLLKGLIHQDIQFPLIPGITKGTRTEIHGKFLNALHEELMEHRWQPRCEKLEEWSKTTVNSQNQTIHSLVNRLKSSHRHGKKTQPGKRNIDSTETQGAPKRRKRTRQSETTNEVHEQSEEQTQKAKSPTATHTKHPTTQSPRDRTLISMECLTLHMRHTRLQHTLSPILTPYTPMHYGLRTREAIQKFSRLRYKASVRKTSRTPNT